LYLTLKKQKRTNHNKIQETLGINWRTAKKYAVEEQLPKSKQKVKKGICTRKNGEKSFKIEFYRIVLFGHIKNSLGRQIYYLICLPLGEHITINGYAIYSIATIF
jgi:glutamate synthase domain-containing protein 1